MHDDRKKSYLEYNRTLIDGVEVKRFKRKSQCYKPHLHIELSIGFIVEGSTHVILGEEPYHFETNDAMIIPPLMTHMCSPKDINHWEVVMFYINPAYYSNVIHFKQTAKLAGKNLEMLKGFIEALEIEKDQVYLESMLIALLLELEVATQHETSERNHLKEKSIAAPVREYILHHFTEEMSLHTLEERFNMNKFTLIRQFKKSYNTTPRAYQLQLKAAEAKSSLTKGENVLDICNRVGFYDQPHFIREFKKMYGISPKAYQESIKS